MAQTQMIELIKRGGVSVLYILGTILAAYNITAFKSDRFGLYFKDDNQLWFAIGAGLIVLAWVIRNWKKM